MIALLADLIGWNRKLIEVRLEKARRLELALVPDMSDEPETVSRSAIKTRTADRERIAVMPKENRR